MAKCTLSHLMYNDDIKLEVEITILFGRGISIQLSLEKCENIPIVTSTATMSSKLRIWILMTHTNTSHIAKTTPVYQLLVLREYERRLDFVLKSEFFVEIKIMKITGVIH